MSYILKWLKAFSQISRPVKTAFLSVIIIGFIAHVAFMTNHFINLDSIRYITIDPNSTAAVSIGRWLALPAYFLVSGTVVSAGIYVPAAVLLLALSSAATTAALKIRHSVFAAFIGSFLVLFPPVVDALSNYALDYFIAIFFASSSVYVTSKWKWGGIVGVLLLTCCIAIHPVQFGYAAGLFLILCMVRCLENQDDAKAILKSGIQYFIVLITSLGLYYAILQIVLATDQVSLSTYRGIDQMAVVNFKDIPALLLGAFQEARYFFRYGIYSGIGNARLSFGWLNQLVLLFAILASAFLAISHKIYRKLSTLILFFIFTALFPFGIHAVAVLGQNLNTSFMMLYPFVLGYVFMLAVLDRIGWQYSIDLIEFRKYAWVKRGLNIVLGVFSACVILISVLLSQQWLIDTNVIYEKLRFSYEHTYATGIILANDILKDEAYSSNMPVAFVGDETPEVFQYRMSFYDDLPYQDNMKEIIHDTDRTEYLMKNFIGMSFEYADAKTISALSDQKEVADMPVYPASGSMRVIDGTFVVKLSKTALG
jgi:hypothetical protein